MEVWNLLERTTCFIIKCRKELDHCESRLELGNRYNYLENLFFWCYIERIDYSPSGVQIFRLYVPLTKEFTLYKSPLCHCFINTSTIRIFYTGISALIFAPPKLEVGGYDQIWHWILQSRLQCQTTSHQHFYFPC